MTERGVPLPRRSTRCFVRCFARGVVGPRVIGSLGWLALIALFALSSPTWAHGASKGTSTLVLDDKGPGAFTLTFVMGTRDVAHLVSGGTGHDTPRIDEVRAVLPGVMRGKVRVSASPAVDVSAQPTLCPLDTLDVQPQGERVALVLTGTCPGAVGRLTVRWGLFEGPGLKHETALRVLRGGDVLAEGTLSGHVRVLQWRVVPVDFAAAARAVWRQTRRHLAGLLWLWAAALLLWPPRAGLGWAVLAGSAALLAGLALRMAGPLPWPRAMGPGVLCVAFLVRDWLLRTQVHAPSSATPRARTEDREGTPGDTGPAVVAWAGLVLSAAALGVQAGALSWPAAQSLMAPASVFAAAAALHLALWGTLALLVWGVLRRAATAADGPRSRGVRALRVLCGLGAAAAAAAAFIG